MSTGRSRRGTWNFGDGTGGTGATPSHTYLNGGTFTVSLQVTDNDGHLSTAFTAPVTVAPAVYASDAFGRTVANGLGSADVGGAYTLSGTAAGFSVTAASARSWVRCRGTGPR